MRKDNGIVKAAAYCRLSKDDHNEGESCSIQTQRNLIHDYINQHGFVLVDDYIDDGFTGRDFERPDFKRMLEDIEKGKINCVITKDLSRFGRNYLEAGIYQEIYFPQHNVRYIAINDNADSSSEETMALAPFRNILNEWYSDDVSKKVRSALKVRFQNGKFRSGLPPYGYIKDPENHNHLIIDENVAPVVRKIFDLALQGLGTKRIKNQLIKDEVLCPSMYSVSRGDLHYATRYEDEAHDPYGWSENSVRNILRNPTYAGHLVGYKRVSAGKKSKHKITRRPDEWEIIPNTHEPIVSQDQFDIVQGMISHRRPEPRTDGFENIFLGLIVCPDCGCAMTMQTAHRNYREDADPMDRIIYQCGNYVRNGVSACTNHTIESVSLYNAVLADIRKLIELVFEDQNAINKMIAGVRKTDSERSTTEVKEQKKLQQRQKELDNLFITLYEDRVAGKISPRNYDMISAKYEAEQEKVTARLEELDRSMKQIAMNSRSAHDFSTELKRCKEIDSLDATILNSLIEKIEIYPRETDSSGKTTQTIKIYYRFIGSIDDLVFDSPDRLPHIATRRCEICGEEYVPRSNVQKYCPACSKKKMAASSLASKQKARQQEREQRGHPFKQKTCPSCEKLF